MTPMEQVQMPETLRKRDSQCFAEVWHLQLPISNHLFVVAMGTSHMHVECVTRKKSYFNARFNLMPTNWQNRLLQCKTSAINDVTD